MKQNIEEVVNEFVEESFKKEKINYRNIIKDHIKEGFKFEKSYNKIEGDIYQKLNNKQFDSDYKDLVYSLEKTKDDYAIDKFNKAIYSEGFQEELKSKNKTLEEFIQLHKDYKKEFEVLVFHHQNREIFKNYFMIKYDDNIKNRISFNDLKLFRGGRENNSDVITEAERLNRILFPPSKSKKYKLEKYGISLTTRDIAVFMTLFKTYYKINFNNYVEFIVLSRLIFDDLHYNILEGDSKLGTSIERYLNGKELFTSKFNFETSQKKILEVLSDINLKDFKKYIKKVEIDKFESLIKQNTRF